MFTLRPYRNAGCLYNGCCWYDAGMGWMELGGRNGMGLNDAGMLLGCDAMEWAPIKCNQIESNILIANCAKGRYY